MELQTARADWSFRQRVFPREVPDPGPAGPERTLAGYTGPYQQHSASRKHGEQVTWLTAPASETGIDQARIAVETALALGSLYHIMSLGLRIYDT